MVTPNNTLTYRPIEVAGNDGKTLRVSTGIKEGEMVALSVGDTIVEGGKVRPIIETPPPGVAPAATATPAAAPTAAPATPAPVATPATAPTSAPTSAASGKEAKSS
jgi:hypothetical protein